ncbi:MAG: hypothetical protein ACJ79S_08015 [Gemmatimonadaceae bacterium]
MSGRARDDAAGGGAESLSVQVQGGEGEPETLYVLSRPRAGVVEVREFRFGTDDGSPVDYTVRADELYDALSRAHRQRRRLSEDLYAIRRWLDG